MSDAKEMSNSPTPEEIARLSELLSSIDKRLSEALQKICVLMEKIEESEDMSDSDDGKEEDVFADSEVTVIPPPKPVLSKTPGQLRQYGYNRNREGQPFSSYRRFPLRQSQTDFGPYPSFGPMAYPRNNPYFT